jgi:GNAT superfamily N-acetyltransferase
MKKKADGRKIEFRKALQQDFDFVFSVEAAIKRPAAEKAGLWEEAAARAKARQAFRPNEDLIVRVDGVDVGLLALGSYKELLWLRRLELLPQFQRQGIGTNIIKTVVQGARAKGAGVFHARAQGQSGARAGRTPGLPRLRRKRLGRRDDRAAG